MNLQKRKWVWIMNPTAYEIRCDKCGGGNITWSEFKHMIWCYDCKKDTPGDGGIFDGPIPIELCRVLGINFDRIHLKTGKILRMKVLEKRLIWKFEREGNKNGC